MNKSLEQILGKWKNEIPKEGYSSSIQLRTYNLYGKKVADFSIDDIRFMIVQRIGLKLLASIALNYLNDNVLVEASYYEGDLLHSLLTAPKSFWESNLNLYSELYQILLKNKEVLSGLNPYYESDKKLIQDYNQFLQVLTKT